MGSYFVPGNILSVLYTVRSNFHSTPESDIFIAYFTSEEPSPPGQLSGCTRIQTDHKAHITHSVQNAYSLMQEMKPNALGMKERDILHYLEG